MISMDAKRPPTPARLRHSGLGIASFVIGLCAAIPIFFILMFEIVAKPHFGDGGEIAAIIIAVGLLAVLSGDDNGNDIVAMVEIFAFLVFFIFVVGLALGIAGIRQAERKKLYVWLGAVINTAILLTAITLIVTSRTNR